MTFWLLSWSRCRCCFIFSEVINVILGGVHSKNCWVENNQIWVILATQRWVILTQPFGLLCLTQQAGLLVHGLKLLHC